MQILTFVPNSCIRHLAALAKNYELCRMLKVICIIWGFAAVGYLLRRWPQLWVARLITYSIWVMLFCIGIEVGANKVLMNSLGRLGLESLTVTLVTAFCCGTGCLFFWNFISGSSFRKIRKLEEKESSAEKKKFSFGKLWHTLQESFIIVAFFIAGVFAGLFFGCEFIPADATLYSLYVLLACVGFGIGQNRDLVRSLKSTKKKLMLLPLVTVLCTWAGSLLTAAIFPHHSITEWLAVGSGFGYYSISSIIITEVKGAELGTIALIYNVMREIFVIVFAPLIFKHFGPLAPISIGGATTADTTLPAITRVSGTALVPVSIFHGILVDFSVPFIVPFFCNF